MGGSTGGATGRTYRSRSAAERSADRRERLLAAALELFGTRGRAATSVSDLCEHAGLSSRQLYQEFANREALLFALYDRINDEAARAVAAELAGSAADPAPQRIRAAITAYLRSTAADTRRARVAFLEVVGVSDEVERERRERRLRWARMLSVEVAAVIESGALPPQDPMPMLVAFIGALNGLAHEWCLDDHRQPVEDVAETLVRLLVGGLTAPPVPRGPAPVRPPQ
ncbi:TetR/AcrR family transcriptional regulator [Actinokineospora bangkokensis]|uniref:HTH tetR-type domain-containing protein n=1 Tax=Actinokineospora bangkokensis TaxID=1193682 RepID=A0A1Q9LMN9_9PSEU|nr:TetR/AcrR family transcriptional regulator [Actinokineospora bangkokensis]OLR93259.1 hypothetical protein BJP25_17400 [Actinokineospora bangkokensis]